MVYESFVLEVASLLHSTGIDVHAGTTRSNK